MQARAFQSSVVATAFEDTSGVPVVLWRSTTTFVILWLSLDHSWEKKTRGGLGALRISGRS